MTQSRTMSLVEAITNVVVGYGIAVVTQIVVFPVFGLYTTLGQNLAMGAAFTIVSLIRSFALRRLFEAIRVRDFSCGRRQRLVWRQSAVRDEAAACCAKAVSKVGPSSRCQSPKLP